MDVTISGGFVPSGCQIVKECCFICDFAEIVTSGNYYGCTFEYPTPGESECLGGWKVYAPACEHFKLRGELTL